MKVLVIGQGGREHALAWKLAQSPQVSALYVAPGNAGTATIAANVSIPPTAVDRLAEWAAREGIDLTVVGPEAALAAGVVDAFRARGLRIFGPTRAAARLETSKAFAKAFMARHGIATAAFQHCANADAAAACIAATPDARFPLVIKADGLAAGKGVCIAHDRREALAAVRDARAGHAGGQWVVEEYLQGFEVSFLAISDGTHVRPLACAHDYKRAYDGDRGPMTGGMGAYSPVGHIPQVTRTPGAHSTGLDPLSHVSGAHSTGFGPPSHMEARRHGGDAEPPESQGALWEMPATDYSRNMLPAGDEGTLTYAVMRAIIEPAIAGMAAEGTPYAGILYAGLMLTEAGPRVLEFNARFGDPETQVLLPRWRDDLAAVLLATADGRLADLPPFRWSDDAACGVVLASAGYPDAGATGAPIQGLRAAAEAALVFHGATAIAAGANDDVVTAGGRVLTVVGQGATLDEARRRAYTAAGAISFPGCWSRTDIAALMDINAVHPDAVPHGSAAPPPTQIPPGFSRNGPRHDLLRSGDYAESRSGDCDRRSSWQTPLRVGVLVSGRGSNLQALLAAYPAGHPLAQIVCVTSNRPACPALRLARDAGVAAFTVERSQYRSREAQHAAIAAQLRAEGVELAVLAGFDQIVTEPLLDAFAGRMINVHPSLLPAFAGTLHAPRAALHHGVKVSGCTVHYVTADVDGGPIIAQAAVPVLEDDDEASLAARILEQEHRLLPRVVAWIAEGRVQIDGRRVRIIGHMPEANMGVLGGVAGKG